MPTNVVTLQQGPVTSTNTVNSDCGLLSYCDQSRGRLSSLLRSVRLGGSLQWVPLTMIRFRCESTLLTTVIFVLFESHQGPSPLIRTLLKPHISVFLSVLGLKSLWKAASKNAVSDHICGFVWTWPKFISQV